MADTDEQTVEVTGGRLHVTRFGPGSRDVLGIHGITASSMSLAVVARHLGPDATLVAPDLRGRGASAGLPGPYGMRAHAEDCAAVITALCEPPVVVLGHSMGAFVAVVLAATHPELVERLVLADGGLPLPLPEGALADMDPDKVIDAVLGPAIERLAVVFPTEASYFDFARAPRHGGMEQRHRGLPALRPPTGGGWLPVARGRGGGADRRRRTVGGVRPDPTVAARRALSEPLHRCAAWAAQPTLAPVPQRGRATLAG